MFTETSVVTECAFRRPNCRLYTTRLRNDSLPFFLARARTREPSRGLHTLPAEEQLVV